MKFAHKGLNLFLVLLLLIGSVCLPVSAASSGSEQGGGEPSPAGPGSELSLTVEPDQEAYRSGDVVTLQARFGTTESPIGTGIQWHCLPESEEGPGQTLEEDSDRLSFTVPENPGEDMLEITVFAFYEGQTQQAVLNILPDEPELSQENPESQESEEGQKGEEDQTIQEPLNQENPEQSVAPANLAGEGLSLSSADEHNRVPIGAGLPLMVHDQEGNEVTTSSALVWTSQVPEVASVDSDGVVTGKLAGIVYITAALEENREIKGSLAVTVGDSLDPELTVVARTPTNNQNNVYPGYNPQEVSLTYNRPIDGENPIGAVALYLSTGSLISSSLPVAWDEEAPNKLKVDLSKSLWSEVGAGCVPLAFNKTYKFEMAAGAVPVAGSSKTSPAITGTSGPNCWYFKTGQPLSIVLAPAGSSARPASLKIGEMLTLTATVNIPSPVPQGTDFKLEWQSDSPQAVPVDGTEKYTLVTNAQGLVNKLTVTKEITGQDLGKVKLTASLSGIPSVSKDWYVEVQASYNQKLAPLWTYAVPITTPGHGKPALTSDGSSYTVLSNPFGDVVYEPTRYLLALDPEGRPKAGFASPVLTQLFPARVVEQEGQEYVLVVQEKSLLALDPDTGAVLRQVELPAQITGMPGLGPNGQIYLSCANNALYSLDLSDEKWTWSFPVVQPILNAKGGQVLYSAPTVDQSNQVYLVHGDTLSVLNGLNGELLWEYKTPAAASFKTQAAVDEGGRVYLVDNADQIYCLNPPGGGQPVSLAWQNSSCRNVMIFPPLIMPEGLLVSSEGRLVELDLATGAKTAKNYAIDYSLCVIYPKNGPDPQLGADGLLYTTRGIYAPDGTVVAYYAEPNTSFPNNDYSMFALSEDGTLYRAIKSGESYDALEKARLYDLTGAVPVQLVIGQPELTLYSEESGRVLTQVLDQAEVSLPGVALEWSSADPQVAAVSSDGLITAAKRTPGQEQVTTTVTVKVKDSTDPALSQAIQVTVLPQAVVQSMVFIYDKNDYAGKTLSDYQVVGEKLSEVNGEAFSPIRVFVADQSGYFVPKQLIKWELIKEGDETGKVAMLNYQGGSGDDSIRYNANLTGKEVGTISLKASLINNPEIYCTVKLEVLPAPYEILWQLPLGGSYGKKVAELATGRRGEIFYVNQNQLQAVRRSDATPLWTSDPGSYYGISLSAPQVDENGNVFLYATNSTAVVAVEAQSGKVLWGYTAPGNDPVAKLVFGGDSVLALTKGGLIYKLDKAKGEPQWNQPYAAGGVVSGLAAASTGKAYYSSGSTVYELSADGQKKSLYTKGGAGLKLEGSSAAGALILQQQEGSQVSLLALDPGKDDPLQWVYPLAERVVVTVAPNGMVYAVSAPANQERKHLYFLRPDGTAQVDGQFQVNSWKKEAQGLYTPVIGENGQLYIPLVGLYVFDLNLTGEQGEMLSPLWQAEIKDEFSITVPHSIAPADEGMVFLSMGELGLVALQGTDLSGGEGLQVKVSNSVLKLGGLQELKIKLMNQQLSSQSVRLTITLIQKGNQGTEQVISYSSLTDTLTPGLIKEYPGSLRIPKTGNYQVKIQVAAPDQLEPVQTILLPVQAQ
ncbi:PQQ-binding-like beta-propeller repeat protein [Desulfosporosinus youngiae]|uniref:Pyrrolo-quinoline quinone repeat domain-containing protein n=1 Tax=Desulfosporosinus youngiae DSM 17734 TaxID=768710 RepID=H5Y5S3_9FIRM|nr:PQQ-binding-like beta-propeller repeat protein [Desulfosporosinus youngiae]EHQ90799.1 hypothetical protein DesyoDRAFT_3814 [Desulfosporosinus youngiae DSM 17734]